MTTGAGRDAERFAAAVDNGYRYAGAMSPGDDELARDLELVALLRSSRESLAPSADASARMRAKVMAAAAAMMSQPAVADAETTSPNLLSDTMVDHDRVADGATEDTNVVSIGSARGRHRFPRRASSSSDSAAVRRSGLGISAAAALALLAITGGGALFSKDALPGDTLYGVKQATESGRIALAGKGEAQRRLDVAATRIDEVQQLNSSSASPTERGADIQQALHGFNDQTTTASRTWLSSPNTNSGDLATWANAQSQRLSGMRASMPASAQSDADNSIRLLEQVRSRANALSSRKGCDAVTTGQSDQFGPIPARGACSAKDSAPVQRPIVPALPTTNERANAPSSGSHSGSSSSKPKNDTDSDSGSNSGGGLLPDLTNGGGLLPDKVPTSDGTTSTREPGLLGGLLGGGN